MTLVAAAEAFDTLLDEAARSWTAPSVLAGYTVGGLVAHTAMAVAFTRTLLDSVPPDDLRPIGAARYYTGMEGGVGPGHDFLRSVAEANAGKGPEAGRAYFRAAVEEVTTRLGDEDPARVLDARPGLPFAIAVADFVATRVVELVVHGDDLAASLGVEHAPPREAADLTVGLLVDAARARHGDAAVLRTLARGERAEPGVFPVL